MEQQIELVRVEIAKLELKENDFLVLKFPGDSDLDKLNHLMELLEKHYPSLKRQTMIFVGEIEISTIHRE